MNELYAGRRMNKGLIMRKLPRVLRATPHDLTHSAMNTPHATNMITGCDSQEFPNAML
jgi:hypothetical protein